MFFSCNILKYIVQWLTGYSNKNVKYAFNCIKLFIILICIYQQQKYPIIINPSSIKSYHCYHFPIVKIIIKNQI